jgi:hypothetical protein
MTGAPKPASAQRRTPSRSTELALHITQLTSLLDGPQRADHGIEQEQQHEQAVLVDVQHAVARLVASAAYAVQTCQQRSELVEVLQSASRTSSRFLPAIPTMMRAPRNRAIHLRGVSDSRQESRRTGLGKTPPRSSLLGLQLEVKLVGPIGQHLGSQFAPEIVLGGDYASGLGNFDASGRVDDRLAGRFQGVDADLVGSGDGACGARNVVTPVVNRAAGGYAFVGG